MNIFFVDRDPTTAAQMLCNAHVRSQIKESMQMMSVAHYIYGIDDKRFLPITHKNHPSTVWVRENRNNYGWMVQHLKALLAEYKFRHGNPHRYEEDFPLYEIVPSGLPYASGYSASIPPAVVSEDLKPKGPDRVRWSAVETAYRAYYNREKRHLHHWMERPKPHWILDDVAFAEAMRLKQEAQTEGTITDGTTHP